MSTIKQPPLTENLVGEDGKPTLAYKLFFDNLWRGDRGTAWNPSFTNLTITGTPTITGRYYQLGQICYFEVKIVPATNTSCTAGTTYINNFPLSMGADGICGAVSGLLGTNLGACDQASGRIYPPSWVAVTIPLTIIGIVRAS